ncbi:hypothetical protein B0T10DRAFT_170169 [Thelonectria olida]|uniref:Uncharacterized protein n=1 Tax=Thelonectria olida TaxID=1576542 RepID=A0A9P8WC94_9HYPO|nr:hypothetical protein B0T10DRAFT_170169 [Thelonectria olida]
MTPLTVPRLGRNLLTAQGGFLVPVPKSCSFLIEPGSLVDVFNTWLLATTIGLSVVVFVQSDSRAPACLVFPTWDRSRLLSHGPISGCKCTFDRDASAHHPTLAWMVQLVQRTVDGFLLLSSSMPVPCVPPGWPSAPLGDSWEASRYLGNSKSQSQSIDRTGIFLLPLPDGKDGSIWTRGPLIERALTVV